MRHGSLFSGYGGLDMAVNAVFGSSTAWVSDVDSGACKVLAHRFPGVPNLGDVTTIDWDLVVDVLGPIDILSGGSPCQDLSTAGRRAGMTEGTRSNLWVAMREGISRVRPRYVVWENVRGAYSARANSNLDWAAGLLDEREADQHPAKEDPALRALGRVLGDLADLGYDAQWCGLRASDVGAPHQRFRVFLLAHTDQLGPHRSGSAGLEARRGEPEDCDVDVADTVSLQPERRRGRGDLAGPSGTGEGDGPERQRNGNAVGDRGPTAADATGIGRVERRTEPTWQQGRLGTTGDPTLAADADHPGRCQQRCTLSAAPTHTAVECGGGTDWGKYGPAVRRWEQVTGNPAPSPVDERNRLTAQFPEWMMGLPPGWITDVPGVTRTEAIRMAGNGVVWQQAVAALSSLLPLAELV